MATQYLLRLLRELAIGSRLILNYIALADSFKLRSNLCISHPEGLVYKLLVLNLLTAEK
jgi:hypothetical protein